jgi:hypothetical protein
VNLYDSNKVKDIADVIFKDISKKPVLELRKLVIEEERNFKDRLGNIAFYHPIFQGSRLTSRASRSAGEGYPHFNIKHDGAVRVVEGLNLTAEFPRLNTDLRRKCMTIEDYLYKMSFLVKYAIKTGIVFLSVTHFSFCWCMAVSIFIGVQLVSALSR